MRNLTSSMNLATKLIFDVQLGLNVTKWRWQKKHSEVTKDKSFPRYIHLIYLHCALISSSILHHNVAWLPREPAQMAWSVNSSQNKGCKCKKPIENVLLVTCDFGSWRNRRKLGHSLSFANRSWNSNIALTFPPKEAYQRPKQIINS